MALATVYIETTIPSYLTARRSRELQLAADQQSTEEWWNEHRQHYECYISPVVLEEVRRGNLTYAAARLKKLEECTLILENPAAFELTNRLLKDQVVPAVAANDASHLALAASYGIDFLLTWNCKHIHNPHLLRRIERACEASNLIYPVICSPAELMIP